MILYDLNMTPWFYYDLFLSDEEPVGGTVMAACLWLKSSLFTPVGTSLWAPFKGHHSFPARNYDYLPCILWKDGLYLTNLCVIASSLLRKAWNAGELWQQWLVVGTKTMLCATNFPCSGTGEKSAAIKIAPIPILSGNNLCLKGLCL